jgi:hypothetical protein
MRAIIYIATIILLSGCGANYHLRKAERHLATAVAKGAQVKVDTVFKEIQIEKVRVDTVVHNITLEKLLRDTITVTQKDVQVKIKYVPKENKVQVRVNSTKPRIVRVPVIVTKKIMAGHSNADMIILSCVALVFGFFTGVIYKTMRNKKQ